MDGSYGRASALRSLVHAFALRAFAGKLVCTADRLGFLPRPLLRRLLIGAATLHLPEDALTLHFFLERAQRLIDVIVANEYLNQNRLLRVAHLSLRADKYEPHPYNARKKILDTGCRHSFEPRT